jgi:hypothetical protein
LDRDCRFEDHCLRGLGKTRLMVSLSFHHERDGVRENPERVNRRVGGLHEISCGVTRNKSAAIGREKIGGRISRP